MNQSVLTLRSCYNIIVIIIILILIIITILIIGHTHGQNLLFCSTMNHIHIKSSVQKEGHLQEGSRIFCRNEKEEEEADR
jgi:hypothetical protein